MGRCAKIEFNTQNSKVVTDWFRKNSNVSEVISPKSFWVSLDWGQFFRKTVEKFVSDNPNIPLDVEVDQDEEGYSEDTHTKYYVREGRVVILDGTNSNISIEKLSALNMGEVAELITNYNNLLSTIKPLSKFEIEGNMKVYRNNFDFDTLTDFEKAFLQSVVFDAGRTFSDTVYDCDDLADDEIKYIESIIPDLDIRSLDDEAIKNCLEVAREAEKIFDIPTEGIQSFAGDMLFDLLYDHEYFELDSQAKKDFFEKHFSGSFGTPMISVSVYNDIRVFCG